MSYPSSIDSITNPSGTSLLTSPDHAASHGSLNTAITAVETKLGIGSGSAALNQILVGSGAGTSAWGTTVNNLNLGTPVITGGTLNGQTFGTPTLTSPTITVGSDATGDIYARSGGSVTRIPGSTTGLYLTAQGVGTLPTYSIAKLNNGTTIVGTTSAPTTNSGGGAVMPEMLGTVTTNGGRLLCYYSGAIASNDNTKTGWISFQLDGAGSAGEISYVDSLANCQIPITNHWLFTGLSSAAHTVSVWWRTNGTLTATGVERHLTLIEI